MNLFKKLLNGNRVLAPKLVRPRKLSRRESVAGGRVRNLFTALSLCAAFVLPQAADSPGMVQVPAGEFWMGRIHMWLIDELSMHLRLRLDDQPMHLVHLDAFYIDRYEVTNEDYARFVSATNRSKPFHWKGGMVPAGQEKFPVYNVNWNDADAYCKWAGKRLPTEAEWEKAARGGKDKQMYPWGDDLSPGGSGGRGGGGGTRMAYYGLPNGPTGVGSYPPNGYGLHDMIGNVAEWVGDWYYRTYYSVSPEANPKGPDSGMYRVFRGSSWSETDERSLATHYRNYTNPETRTNVIGFRCTKN